MGNRRKARELAMQALFSMDMSQNGSKDILERFCDNFKPSSKALSFFLKLVQGVLHTRTEIDAVIERYSKNWKLNRMSCVDRNIMRVAEIGRAHV